ncbi:hypothetical protein [Nocardia sp. NPDC051570]|uniref:hypothetical protein n=1 Tax=Nocardia sp. NPDC051570 TaxID=3364324 RepID=UPI0037A5C8AD
MAGEVISRVADIAGMWEEMLAGGLLDSELADVDPDEARQQLSEWMSKLPGKSCDNRLPQPD